MSTIKATTLSNLAGSKTVPTDTVVDGSAKAWVNFNGTGTVAIRRAFNVSSITDVGTGNYTVNITNAFADTNYGYHAQPRATLTNFVFCCPPLNAVKTTSSLELMVVQSTAGTPTDSAEVDVAIFS